jgi:hypothetical protein
LRPDRDEHPRFSIKTRALSTIFPRENRALGRVEAPPTPLGGEETPVSPLWSFTTHQCRHGASPRKSRSSSSDDRLRGSLESSVERDVMSDHAWPRPETLRSEGFSTIHTHQEDWASRTSIFSRTRPGSAICLDGTLSFTSDPSSRLQTTVESSFRSNPEPPTAAGSATTSTRYQSVEKSTVVDEPFSDTVADRPICSPGWTVNCSLRRLPSKYRYISIRISPKPMLPPSSVARTT